MFSSRHFLIAASIAGAFALSHTDVAAQAPVKKSGGILVDELGMTLYVFDKDQVGSGKSVCNGPCAANWPPVLVAPDSQPQDDYTILTRDDGRKQWAYKGRPLYLGGKDQKPGDRNGDGLNQVWHVIIVE
jgi:predicted lipoprotein with Yx(FWY)xxD motif